MDNIAIVIPCYKRPVALKRLLDSVDCAIIDRNADIVFSIDFSGEEAVYNVAKDYIWKYGKKRIIRHESNLGLRRNLISCGRLTQVYDAVIVLEEDFVVAPDFLNYALQAAEYYADNERIAGISLYKYELCEFGYFRFYPIETDKDTLFIQYPSSRGQLWTRLQWNQFDTWYMAHESCDLSEYNLPVEMLTWTKSWKKYYAAYMVDTQRYFVYPYVSYSNVFGTIGEHYNDAFNWDTVSMYYGHKDRFRFQSWPSEHTYDVFLQLQGVTVELDGCEQHVDMDLYGTKQPHNLLHEYVVTPCLMKNVRPVKSWGSDHIPFEMNVLKDYRGDYFHLYRVQDFVRSSLSPEQKLYQRIMLTRRDKIKQIVMKLIKKMKSIAK